MIFEILFKIKIVLVLKNGGKTTENQKYCYRDTGKKNCRIEEAVKCVYIYLERGRII